MLALQSLSVLDGVSALKRAALTKSRKELAGRRGGEVPLEPGERHGSANQGWGMSKLKSLLRSQKGASAIEYALVATLISIAAISAFHNLGNKIDTMDNNVGNAM